MFENDRNLDEGSGAGEHIQKRIDLLERVGQKKNSDGDQKKAAHDVDDPHVTFYFVEGGEERIHRQGGKKKRNSQACRIISQKQNSGRDILRCAGVDQDRGKDRPDAGSPPRCKNHPDEE